MISTASVIAANEQQVAAKVMDGEAILIHLGTGVYYSMSETGGFIWLLIERQTSIEEMVSNVVQQYDVDAARAREDVLRVAEELCTEGLAIVSHGSHAQSAPLDLAASRLAYQSPSIEKFTDMAEMFALDPPLPGLSQTAARH